MNTLPLAKNNNIVVQELGKEILIYDLSTHKAYNLNETSATVYRACDGETSFDELRRKHKFTDDLIFLALDQLKEDNLIEADNTLVSAFNGMSRREAIRKVGLASMVALPVITSLVAPTAAMAQSGGGLPATCGAACTCNAGGNVQAPNTFCTETVNTCGALGACQCFATNCPADTAQPCTGYCASLLAGI